jgi:hypothetical protein
MSAKEYPSGLQPLKTASTTLITQSALGARCSAGMVAAHGEVPHLVPELSRKTQKRRCRGISFSVVLFLVTGFWNDTLARQGTHIGIK